MENHPFRYDIDYVMDGITHFEDFIDSSFYLIEGKDKALLIDTGCGGGNVMRLASAFTKKPIECAVTHAHGDHYLHASEFEKVYMHRADIEPLDEMIAMFGASEEYPISADMFTPLEDGSVIDLGGFGVRTLLIPGHTAGSVIFVDEGHKAVFTGDAIGSGRGVWMQLPRCTTVSQYKKDLLHLATNLYPYRDYLFLGGHFRQAGQPGTPEHNPVSMRMVEEMIHLCDDLLAGRAQDELYDMDRSFGDERAHIASRGTATMVYLPSNVK